MPPSCGEAGCSSARRSRPLLSLGFPRVPFCSLRPLSRLLGGGTSRAGCGIPAGQRPVALVGVTGFESAASSSRTGDPLFGAVLLSTRGGVLSTIAVRLVRPVRSSGPGFVPFLFPRRRSPPSPGRWLTRAARNCGRHHHALARHASSCGLSGRWTVDKIRPDMTDDDSALRECHESPWHPVQRASFRPTMTRCGRHRSAVDGPIGVEGRTQKGSDRGESRTPRCRRRSSTSM